MAFGTFRCILLHMISISSNLIFTTTWYSTVFFFLPIFWVKICIYMKLLKFGYPSFSSSLLGSESRWELLFLLEKKKGMKVCMSSQVLMV